MPGTLLAEPYPTADEWKRLVEEFSADAIAHKLLLAHVPFVFRVEPLKYSVFRRVIADSFSVQPTDVFIVGSAMAGRSLKGRYIEKEYSPASDIDTLIISEPLFTTLLMRSLEWVRDVTRSNRNDDGEWQQATLEGDALQGVQKLSDNACKGIWRPDSLPKKAPVRENFFANFERVALHTLGLQLSDDTVAKVNGRVARSFEDAEKDLANSIYRLKMEFRQIKKRGEVSQGGAMKRDERGNSDGSSKAEPAVSENRDEVELAEQD